MTFEEYCRAVSSRIRFKPDRAAVEAELLAHLEDRRDALTARGVPEEEAGARAVAAMGDPAEVGEALDRCHSPLLGWVCTVVRRLAWASGAITLLAAFVLVFLNDGTGYLTRLFPDRAAAVQSACAQAEELTAGADPVELYIQGEARVGRYTFEVERAVLYPGEEGALAVVLLRERWRDPRLGPPVAFPRFEAGGMPLDREAQINLGGETAVFGSLCAYGLWLSGEDGGLSVEICDGWGNERASFSISLRGGAGT